MKVRSLVTPGRIPRCLAVALAVAVIPFEGFGAQEPPVLRVYNWSSYIDIDWSVDRSAPISERSPTLSSFLGENNCHLEYYEYDDEAMMREKVLGQPGFFDVACMSLSDVKLFHDAGRLAKIPPEKTPNREHLMPTYTIFEFDPYGKHYVPYLVGTEGLAYRRDLVGHEVTSWNSYFDPPESLKGKLGALNSAETMLGAAVKSLGYRFDAAEARDLWSGARRLRRLREEGYLGFVTSDIAEIQRRLVSGEMAMSVLYSGDAIALSEREPGENIVYVIPKEGAGAFMDCWVVFEDSRNKELAFRFVNHLIEPENHARIAAQLRYLCPNEEALDILRRDHPRILSNPSILPPEEVMETLEFQWRGDVATMNRLWRRIVD